MNIPQIQAIFCVAVIALYILPLAVCAISPSLPMHEWGLAYAKAWIYPCIWSVLGATLMAVFLEVLSSYHFI